MAKPKIKTALISVYDKSGIVDFARALVEEFGIEIISTGGTAALLKKNKIPVTLVEEITGFPEMLDGRVKTLHPKIFAGILADRDNPEHMRQLKAQGIKPIDMVVVNLYPFEKTVADENCTFEQAIEMIDIGGPSLLRAAAKNHKHVIPVMHDRSHEFVIEGLRESGDLEESGRACLASIVFESVSEYDDGIDRFMVDSWGDLRFSQYPELPEPRQGATEQPPEYRMAISKLLWKRFKLPHQINLQYGENPHQYAAKFLVDKEIDPVKAIEVPESQESLSPMSFNNHLDADAAMALNSEIARSLRHRETAPMACTFVKHTNACGCGVGSEPIEAYRRAYLGDPKAAMGGILACSFPVTEAFVEVVMETYDRWGRTAEAGGFFAEVWIAPEFDSKGVAALRRHRRAWVSRIRLLCAEVPTSAPDVDTFEFRRIEAGVLVQTRDLVGLNEEQWKVVTKRKPSESELIDLRLAWLIAKHTKSNAISICRDGMLIGNGAGQMSRVMSCRIATWLAKGNGHEERLKGAAAASDGFFPFADGPNLLMDAGVTAMIQPGGSKRDEEVIAACDERNVAMILTGTRHFRH